MLLFNLWTTLNNTHTHTNTPKNAQKCKSIKVTGLISFRHLLTYLFTSYVHQKKYCLNSYVKKIYEMIENVSDNFFYINVIEV